MVDRGIEFLEALKWLMEEYDAGFEVMYDYHPYDGVHEITIDIYIGRGYVNIPSGYINPDNIGLVIRNLKNGG